MKFGDKLLPESLLCMWCEVCRKNLVQELRIVCSPKPECVKVNRVKITKELAISCG